MRDPTFLPFLHGPRGFAYVIDSVAEIHEDPLFYPPLRMVCSSCRSSALVFLS